jgi:release factor glutamine methyltransferase
LQYIVGSTSFCGLEMMLDRRVLIPRPETELLAERAWKCLQKCPAPTTALDVGTGSGCLAIALARNAPSSQVHATDYSSEVLQVATRNAERHKAAISWHQGDLFAAIPSDLLFDVIVSNPPYIPSARIETLQPEVREHEPRGALDGGVDGLDFYRKIAIQARPFLRPGGRIMVELDDDGAEAVGKIFRAANWSIESVESDDNRTPRILIAHLPSATHDASGQG